MAQKKSPILTEEQIEMFKDAFSIFDKNNDGTVEIRELRKLFQSLGYNVTEKDVEQYVMERKHNDNNMVAFSDFLVMISKRLQTAPHANEQQIEDAFKTFDRNNDGYITEAEFKVTLRNLGEKLSDDEIKDMIKEVDLNGDGQVDYKEFTAMMLAK